MLATKIKFGSSLPALSKPEVSLVALHGVNQRFGTAPRGISSNFAGVSTSPAIPTSEVTSSSRLSLQDRRCCQSLARRLFRIGFEFWLYAVL